MTQRNDEASYSTVHFYASTTRSPHANVNTLPETKRKEDSDVPDPTFDLDEVEF